MFAKMVIYRYAQVAKPVKTLRICALLKSGLNVLAMVSHHFLVSIINFQVVLFIYFLSTAGFQMDFYNHSNYLIMFLDLSAQEVDQNFTYKKKEKIICIKREMQKPLQTSQMSNKQR